MTEEEGKAYVSVRWLSAYNTSRCTGIAASFNVKFSRKEAFILLEMFSVSLYCVTHVNFVNEEVEVRQLLLRTCCKISPLILHYH